MNNAHQVPALSEVQEYEVALRLATRLMNSKDHVIANLECTNVKQQHIINQQGQTLMERDQKIDQLEHMVHGQQCTINACKRANATQRRTIDEQQHALDEQRYIISELQGDIDDREHKRARFNEQAQRLSKLEGFAGWAPRFMEEQSTGPANLHLLHLLRHSNLGPQTLCLDMLVWLGLAKDPKAVVLGPVLCYILVKLVAIPLEQMTGAIIDKAFQIGEGN